MSRQHHEPLLVYSEPQVVAVVLGHAVYFLLVVVEVAVSEFHIAYLIAHGVEYFQPSSIGGEIYFTVYIGVKFFNKRMVVIGRIYRYEFVGLLVKLKKSVLHASRIYYTVATYGN